MASIRRRELTTSTARYLDLADVDGAIEIVDTATSDLSTAELVKRIHELLDELERRCHEH
jgi:hypothetical protein